MTAVAAPTTERKSLYSYPPGSFEKRLYQRLFEISLNPAYSQGFRTLAMEAKENYSISIRPDDLSTESIHDALLSAAKKAHKAWKKRWRAGERDLVPFPETWKAFIATAKNGCRFSRWCDGSCEPSVAGDRQHWSITNHIHGQHFADALGLQIFQNESANGNVSPAYLILSYYEQGLPFREGEAYDIRLTPAEARKFGEVMFDACSSKAVGDGAPGVVLDEEFASGDRLVLERHRPRARKDGYPDREVFELALYPVDEDAPLRMRSDYSNPWWLGKHLMREADDAEGVVRRLSSAELKSIEMAGTL